jgi:hypothetical protein
MYVHAIILIILNTVKMPVVFNTIRASPRCSSRKQFLSKLHHMFLFFWSWKWGMALEDYKPLIRV